MNELLSALLLQQRLMESLSELRGANVDFHAKLQYALDGIVEQTAITELYLAALRIKTLPVAQQQSELDRMESRLQATPFPVLVRNQLKYRWAKAFVLLRRRKQNEAAIEYKAIASTVEQNIRLLMDTQIREDYYSSLLFLALDASQNKNFVEVERILNQLEELANRWGGGLENDQSLYGKCMQIKLALKVDTGDWASALQLVRKVYQEVVLQGKLNYAANRSSLVHSSAYVAFLSRDFQTCRKLILDLRTVTSPFQMSPHLLFWPRMVYLLSLLEESDEFFIKSYKETITWLESVGLTDEFVEIMMGFFKKASKEVMLSTSLLIETQNALISCLEVPSNIYYRRMFPILEWIKSKINKQDIRELLPLD
jgi:hypothetical protein